MNAMSPIFLSILKLSTDWDTPGSYERVPNMYFYNRSIQNNESKEHCFCIKENQTDREGIGLCNTSTLKFALAYMRSSVREKKYFKGFKFQRIKRQFSSYYLFHIRVKQSISNSYYSHSC